MINFISRYNKALKFPHLPDMVFPNNKLQLTYSGGGRIVFSPMEALRGVDTGRPPVQVACAEEWQESRYHQYYIIFPPPAGNGVPQQHSQPISLEVQKRFPISHIYLKKFYNNFFLIVSSFLDLKKLHHNITVLEISNLTTRCLQFGDSLKF